MTYPPFDIDLQLEHHNLIMRTTLSIDDDVLEQVKEYAENRGVPLGRAASDLLRRGITRPAPTHVENGLRVFSRSAAAPTITPELVRTLDGEQDLRKIR
jgi:hypothetical protein